MKLLSLKLFLLVALAFTFTVHAQELDLSGNSGWAKSGSRLRISTAQIHNGRESGTSGSLRLQIWATEEPYDGVNDLVGFVIGTANLRPLVAGEDYFNVAKRVGYHRPPPGYYFTTITLEERYSDGSWLIVDSENFEGQVNLGGFGEGVVDLEASTTSDITFSGLVSWFSGDGRVELEADQIHNFRTSGRSGALRVRLFASEEPYDPAEIFYAYPLATKSAGRLSALSIQHFGPFLTRFRAPPPGEWFITMTLEEYNRGWIIQDYYTFIDPRLF